MLKDQHWLGKNIKQLSRLQQQGAPRDQLESRIAERLQRSLQQRAARTASVPPIAVDQELPIYDHQQEIQAALRHHQVVVVAGETGSGKSTQLPKICLAAGFGTAATIGHTQPRRLAARSIAQRIATELNAPLGQLVGYKVRFQDKTSEATLIKLMTDGMLLAEAATDRFLQQYDMIILDEAHERSLNIDFLLGLLHGLLPKRPDLKLIITSATIDAERFSAHFGTDAEVPIIRVQGRTYPVEVRYRGLEDDEGNALSVYEGIVQGVHELRHEGDILVFLPTERDIREAAKRLRADPLVQQQGREVLPLYARLSMAEQEKIFRPGSSRRVVLATNVAESSLTVPRIHAVIDTGTARISRYSSRLRMQRLPIEAISQASANQRQGRCGRLAPGICLRLYEQEDLENRPEFTTPEIRRTNLASVILQAKHLRLGEVDNIAFLDPPRPETIREGYKTLFEIGAVDDRRRLTPLGKTLAQLPVDPRIGRMVLAAHQERCLADVLIIAAALEVQDPRVRPLDKQQAADQQHEIFQHQDSDFLSFLKLWDFVEQQHRRLSRGQFQRMCQQRFLSPARLREWREVHRHLRQTAIDQGLQPQARRHDSSAIHRALMTGLLSCAAYRNQEADYLGAGGNRLKIWPGSGLFQQRPDWIMAAELVETSQRFGRTVARIDPAWLEDLGSHLTKRSYSDPHWHRKRQTVMAWEKVTLLGLPVVARRRVPYGHIDVETARQIFIEKGLVEQAMEAHDQFFAHNARVREEATALAAKTRQREFVLDDYRIHLFYSERIPHQVHDMATLRQAIKDSPALEASLRMSIDDLLDQESPLDQADFPAYLEVGSMKLPLSYCFQPGSAEDGVTVTVPRAALAQLPAEQLEWLVPGLLQEKLVALIRSLPKSVRRGLVPAPDTAAEVAGQLTFGQGNFLDQVANRFRQISGEAITANSFRTNKLAPHLRMRIEVVDDEGAVQVCTRELAEARQHVDKLSNQPAAKPDNGDDLPSLWHRDDIRDWDFEELPAEVQVPRGGIQVSLYPALVELEEGGVGLRLLPSQGTARARSRAGIRRLYVEQNTKVLRSQIRHLPHWEQTKLFASSRYSRQELESQLMGLLADRAFLGKGPLPRSKVEFVTRQQEQGPRIAVAAQELAAVIPNLWGDYHAVQLALDKLKAARYARSRIDIEHQLQAMFTPHFLVDTPWSWLTEISRFLRAIVYRIDKLTSGGQARDEANIAEIAPHWNRWAHAADNHETVNADALTEYRWMLEEFRVSLFAQSLGTSIKISPQRLEKQWNKVRAR